MLLLLLLLLLVHLLLRILLLGHLLLRWAGLGRRLAWVHTNVGVICRVVLALLRLAIRLLLLRCRTILALVLLRWASITSGSTIVPGTKIGDLADLLLGRRDRFGLHGSSGSC